MAAERKTSQQKKAATTRRSHAALGLDIISLLVHQRDGMRISELAEAMKIDVGQMHRMLASMVDAGWVRHDKEERYEATGKILTIARDRLANIEIRELAMPILDHLAEITGETVHLAEYRAPQLVCIARRASRAAVIATAELGEVWEVESNSAASRCIRKAAELAHHSGRQLADYVAVDMEEYRPGVCAVAAPLFDLQSDPIGALILSAPVGRTGRGRFHELTDALVEAAVELNGALGTLQTSGAGLESGPRWMHGGYVRSEDFWRHIEDLKEMSYEGRVDREEQVEVFTRACGLITPVVEELLSLANADFMNGAGTVRSDTSPIEDGEGGLRQSWRLGWPQQEAATDRFTGGDVTPITVMAVLGRDNIHGHIVGTVSGTWPLQVLSHGDADRQRPVIAAVIESELHQKVFVAQENWRILPN